MAEWLTERLRQRLAVIEAAGLTRRLRAPSGVDLTSNDYLGLAQHPLVKQRMADAAMNEGAGSTGSRLLRGERETFARLEQRFARFKGAERSLYFSSGYLANLAVLSTIPEEGDVIFSDALNHASLIDGMRLSRGRREVFAHNDVSALATRLRAERAHKFLVIESLFSMDGDEAPLAAYAELCRETGTALIVDEAHAVGVYGPEGSGLIEETGTAEAIFASVNTAGKALGVSGAFIAGSNQMIEYLIQRARSFIFTTAAPPPLAAALEASLDIVAAEPDRRARVLDRACYLRQRLRLGNGRSQIIPVILGDNQKALQVAEALQARGFDVRAIRPPTVPEGTARLRLTVNEGLTENVLNVFCNELAKLI